jgi:hypothetical protein
MVCVLPLTATPRDAEMPVIVCSGAGRFSSGALKVAIELPSSRSSSPVEGSTASAVPHPQVVTCSSSFFPVLSKTATLGSPRSRYRFSSASTAIPGLCLNSGLIVSIDLLSTSPLNS